VKTLFTIHAGEFLVGELIGRKFRSAKIWMPAKDTGVDLLVTDSDNRHAVSLQVKFSRDYRNVENMKKAFRGAPLKVCSRWTIPRKKLAESEADYWVFVLMGFASHATDFVIIKPAELLAKLDKIHGQMDTITSYLWVTEDKRCWDARDQKQAEQLEILNGKHIGGARDFTAYLNQWSVIQTHLDSRP
jgi:hypothetical protein